MFIKTIYFRISQLRISEFVYIKIVLQSEKLAVDTHLISPYLYPPLVCLNQAIWKSNKNNICLC